MKNIVVPPEIKEEIINQVVREYRLLLQSSEDIKISKDLCPLMYALRDLSDVHKPAEINMLAKDYASML